MSPVRMPQHLADRPQVDGGEAVLKFELLENLDGLRRSEMRVDRAVAALNEASPQDRPRLLDEAADAVWGLIVQHEACDCMDHSALIARHHVPAEVMARLGARH